MKNSILSLIFILISVSLIAQNRDKAATMLGQRGEIYVKFNYPKQANLYELNKMVSIDKLVANGNSNEIIAYLNTKQYTQFKEKGIDFELLTPPSMMLAASMCPDLNSVKNWNCYPVYSQYIELMQAFETNYPDLCKLVEFGQSVDGRKLLAVKISDNVSAKEDEPEFLYTSTMHGDETTGYVLMLRLIDYLLSNYGSNTRVSELINNTEIWINPASNPDGTYAGGNTTLTGATRGNSNNINLNRNFPDPQDGEHPDGNAWQPETIAMIDFLKIHNFVLAANFHGGAEVVNYPWDTWYTRHADDTWYQEISREYADTVQANSTGYMTDLNDGITNGADWYLISGGRQDYMNYYLHSREVTIELSSIKMVNATTLPNYWNYNYRSLLNYINRVHTGVYGKVTDQDGNHIRAKISLTSHDTDSSEIYSNVSNGMYYRMLSNGTYHLVATLDGYAPAEFDVTVPTNSKAELNIMLQKYPLGVQNIDESIARITQFTNPVSSQIDISLELKQPGDFECVLNDASGKLLQQKQMSGIKGDNQILLDINDLKAGIYFFRLHSKLFNIQLKLLKLKS